MTTNHPDDLAPARGILIATPIGLFLWALILVACGVLR